MKRIGLIGGMSWESTIPYYKIINEEVNAKMGGLHSPNIILYSLDLYEIEKNQSNNNFEKVAEIITKAAEILENSKCDYILICSNTIHKMYNKIQKQIKVPIIHIADATVEKLIKEDIKKVLLIGTQYTMKEDFIKKIIIEKGIEVIVPEEDDIKSINNIIFKELCLGNFNQNTKISSINIINKSKNLGCTGVVLGCTELGMLIKQEDIDIMVFDTTIIHAKKAAELYLQKESK